MLISNHSGFDEAPAKLAALRQAPRGPNPFVLNSAFGDLWSPSYGGQDVRRVRLG